METITLKEELEHAKRQLKCFQYYVLKEEALLQGADQGSYYTLEQIQTAKRKLEIFFSSVPDPRARSMLIDVYRDGKRPADIYRSYNLANVQTVYEIIDKTIKRQIKAGKKTR